MTTGGGDAIDASGPGVWETGKGHLPASWDLEADVVVIGASTAYRKCRASLARGTRCFSKRFGGKNWIRTSAELY